MMVKKITCHLRQVTISGCSLDPSASVRKLRWLIFGCSVMNPLLTSFYSCSIGEVKAIAFYLRMSVTMK